MTLAQVQAGDRVWLKDDGRPSAWVRCTLVTERYAHFVDGSRRERDETEVRVKQ